MNFLGAQKSAVKKWEKAFKEVKEWLVAPRVPVNPSDPSQEELAQGGKGLDPIGTAVLSRVTAKEPLSTACQFGSG